MARGKVKKHLAAKSMYTEGEGKELTSSSHAPDKDAVFSQELALSQDSALSQQDY